MPIAHYNAENGVVLDVWAEAPIGWPEKLPTAVVSADVQTGWVTADGGETFAAPVAPAVDLRAYAAVARFALETAGIKVGNAPVATDRESQANITSLWVAAQLDPNLRAQFKSDGGGYASLVAGQIQAIASAVTAHVQACRATEAQVDAAIAAGTMTTTAQVDAAFAAVTA